jgi:hypothetical protein
VADSYSVGEFEKLLASKFKLTKSDMKTATVTYWKTPGGQHITVPILPNGESYHYWHLEVLERGLKRMSQHPDQKKAK